jgi:hypothetical protein
MQIAAAKLVSINYGYYNDQFFIVVVSTKGLSNKSELLRAFAAQFGRGNRPNRYLDKYIWLGNISSIVITCNSITDDCDAAISSTAISNQIEADSHEAAKKSAKDF